MAAPLIAAGIAAGANLLGGLMQQKAAAEQARKQRAFDALQSEAQQRMLAQRKLAEQQQQALGGLLGSFQKGLIL